ncbi:uncharacterized protein LOC134178168 [Corticium candelabrum]|uniref:uncharacterized protein LOC134178168 n=1 Tax=Corticium candelabrum TaxID=121492 RepID=UPI002E255B34|nr:uncharacterized protein LOC134178168 [Corticium candelabrum]XP_062500962.1 uncharacterized protein LOC134178168 [Corticium candelabrum]XP_062500964.1 uncharacterized protein LOC134178168 [Corticium candelabrum]
MAERPGSYECLFKLLVIGDTGVGKTCVMLRYVDNTFSKSMLSTIGVDFKTKTIVVDRRHVKLQIWDTAGHERFRTITNAFYRGAMGVLLVYDITCQKSFSNITQWMKNIAEQCAGGDEPALLMVGNKSDLEDNRVVQFEQGQELATRYGVKFLETSAQSGKNVEEAFLYLAEEMLKKEVSSKPEASSGNQKDRLVLSRDKNWKTKRCGCKR